MGLVERFSKLRSRWSRNFPPNLARLMLLGCAALWGGSYLLAKFAMEAIPPQWLMGLRMIGACLCMLALFHKHIVPYLTPKIIVPALVVGLTYWGTMVTQTIGLQTSEQLIAPDFQRIGTQIKRCRLIQAVRQCIQFRRSKTPGENFIQPVRQVKANRGRHLVKPDRLGLRQPFRLGFAQETVEFTPVHPLPASQPGQQQAS